MKRVVAFIMTGALVTSLTGCSNIVDDTIGKVTKGIDTIGSSVNKGADAIGEFEEGLLRLRSLKRTTLLPLNRLSSKRKPR